MEAVFCAVIDGKIVGAIQLKFYTGGGKKFGYYEYAFIDPDYHNKGVGNVLYSAVAEYLWAQDCKVLTALVKEDSVGSWSLLMKNGFTRISLLEVVRQFGLLGALRLYFGSILGMDYYVALPGQKCVADKGGSLKQIAAYLFANFLLFFCMLFQGVDEIGLFFAAYVTYLLMAVGTISVLAFA